jgi:hypothetical protein
VCLFCETPAQSRTDSSEHRPHIARMQGCCRCKAGNYLSSSCCYLCGFLLLLRPAHRGEGPQPRTEYKVNIGGRRGVSVSSDSAHHHCYMRGLFCACNSAGNTNGSNSTRTEQELRLYVGIGYAAIQRNRACECPHVETIPLRSVNPTAETSTTQRAHSLPFTR